MSLLWMDYDSEFEKLTDTAFSCQRLAEPEYFEKMEPRVENIIYRDTRYNIDFLYTSYLMKEDKILTDYVVWLYGLLNAVFKKENGQQTADYIINHFEYIREGVKKEISAEKQPRLMELLDEAQEKVREAAKQPESETPSVCRYENEIDEYLESLFAKDARKAVYSVQQWMEKGIPLNDIYVEILAECMRRIGELWHTAKISVDTEHYCTSITQMAMAQLYPVLFSKERKNKTLLCACPGTELHEMGARMVADLFENDGWDSIYLGAAVPESAMLSAIRENKPDLVALSVTMPQHLLACRSMVDAIKREFPDLCVAVGGHAFASTHEIWSQWPVDLYTKDAKELLAAANKKLER